MKNTLKAILLVMSLTFTLAACGPKPTESTGADSTVVEPTPPAEPADSVPADSTQM